MFKGGAHLLIFKHLLCLDWESYGQLTCEKYISFFYYFYPNRTDPSWPVLRHCLLAVSSSWASCSTALTHSFRIYKLEDYSTDLPQWWGGVQGAPRISGSTQPQHHPHPHAGTASFQQCNSSHLSQCDFNPCQNKSANLWIHWVGNLFSILATLDF